MKISELAKKYQTKTSIHKTEEGEIISEFMKEINIERIGSKYKPVTFMAVKMKLGAIYNDKHAMRSFLSNCRDSARRNKSFSKVFFGALKTK